ATLLVAASPCAIVISVPAAILSALSAAHGGVLFNGGAALETRAAGDIFDVDKTGTLTSGRVDVTEIVTLDGSETGFRALEQRVERQMAGANVLDADRYQLVVMLDYHSARVPWRSRYSSCAPMAQRAASARPRACSKAFRRWSGLTSSRRSRCLCGDRP